MKIYCVNFNGVMDGLIELLKKTDRYTDNYHEADALVLWQDVRGDMARVAEIAQNRMGKPVFVMQHGRGATRDYCEPNKFPLKADKIFVWGRTEEERLLKAGIAKDRIAVTGCPLIKRLRPKVKRDGKNILFVPVISSKEEPENILVHAELKKWEAGCVQKFIRENFDHLKSGWATENVEMREPEGGGEPVVWRKEVVPTIPRNIIHSKGLVNVKLCPIHDASQYQSPLIITSQNEPKHLENTIEMLGNVDVIVCLEEGTMQLLAFAMDIPVIVVDIFKYGEYGGQKDYDKIEKIKTSGAVWIRDLSLLGQAVEGCLADSTKQRPARIKACEDEGGAHLGDPDLAVVEEIRQFIKIAARKKEEKSYSDAI